MEFTEGTRGIKINSQKVFREKTEREREKKEKWNLNKQKYLLDFSA